VRFLLWGWKPLQHSWRRRRSGIRGDALAIDIEDIKLLYPTGLMVVIIQTSSYNWGIDIHR